MVKKTDLVTFIKFQELNTFSKERSARSLDKRLHIILPEERGENAETVNYIYVMHTADKRVVPCTNINELINDVLNKGFWVDNVTKLSKFFSKKGVKVNKDKVETTKDLSVYLQDLLKSTSYEIKRTMLPYNNSEGLTINALTLLCLEQIKKGNGEKHVLLSDDDEGNGYHTLFYGMQDDINELQCMQSDFHDNNDYKTVVVLG